MCVAHGVGKTVEPVPPHGGVRSRRARPAGASSSRPSADVRPSAIPGRTRRSLASRLAQPAAALGWLWVVEGVQPDRADLLGACLCVLGATIILFRRSVVRSA